jgi:hypothetical protein
VIKLRCLILIAAMAVLSMCTEKKGDKRTSDMTFKVDMALLEEPLRDEKLGISFSPPKGCVPVSPKILQQTKTLLEQHMGLNDPLLVQPRHIFLNQEARFLCALSRLPTVHNDSSLAAYKKYVSDKMAMMDIKQAYYPYRGLEIFQMRMESEEMIAFKLIIPQTDSSSFQLDYVIPKPVYMKNLEAIESSIGSLEKLGRTL